MAKLKLKCELDPTIWSNLPHDILLDIIEQSDLSTQINWSRTSRELFPVASSKIWGSLRVHSLEITAYVDIVTGIRSTNRTDSIVHFLLESAYRRHDKWDHVFGRDSAGGVFIYRPNGRETYSNLKQLTTTLPVSYIKDLEIDNQGFHNIIDTRYPADLIWTVS